MFKVNSRNNRKRCKKRPKLTINTIESRLGVFIVNIEHISHFFKIVSTVYFEWVNVCRGILSCVNISTQNLKMSRCFIQHDDYEYDDELFLWYG